MFTIKHKQTLVSALALVLASIVVLYAATANDDFTDTNGTSLTAHTPTGSGAGGTWNVLVGSGTADIQTNHVEETNSGDGNRFRNTADLGFDEMDVQADFTTSASAGQLLNMGVLGRLPAAAASTSYECYYDLSDGAWHLEDGTNAGTPLTQAWPGGTVTIKLVLRANNVSCLGNAVSKVTLTSNVNTGNTRAGIKITNFEGVARLATVDNYQSSGFSGGGGGASPKKLPLLGVGDEFATRPN